MAGPGPARARPQLGVRSVGCQLTVVKKNAFIRLASGPGAAGSLLVDQAASGKSKVSVATL